MTQPPGASSVEPATAAALHRIAIEGQRASRYPGLHVTLARHGEVLWQRGIGVAQVGSDEAPTADDQFLIASNTKTFVATMILQLRDAGRLDLEDQLADHLPGLRHRISIRDALQHLGGLQREPSGDVWDTLVHPDEATLLREASDAEQVLRAGETWHYSNLVFSLLGQVVTAAAGSPWHEVLRERVLTPLGMSRTSVGFDGGARAHGYFVSEWHDVPQEQPVVDLRGTSPAGALASTAADLTRWTGFIARPDAAVLAPDTVAEMTTPRRLLDTAGWSRAMALGFFVARTPGGRNLTGHTGSLPGFRTAVFTDRDSGVAAIVLGNGATGGDITALCCDLVDSLLEREPPLPEPWRPGVDVPGELEPMLGLWYSEGSPWLAVVRDGGLELRSPATPAGATGVGFTRVETDVFRTTTGEERGELLRVVRTADGDIESLSWATYRMTRRPQGFG